MAPLRTQMAIDASVGEFQSGLRKTRQASEPVFVLRRIAEEVQACGGELTLVKLDMAHALDTIDTLQYWKRFTALTLTPYTNGFLLVSLLLLRLR